MHSDVIILFILLIGVVLLISGAVHFAARFISSRSDSLAMPVVPTMGAGTRRVLGCVCVLLGGLWCLGLVFARVDPPGVPGGFIVMASSLFAWGINLLGTSTASAARRAAHWTRIVPWISVAIWVIVTVALVSWHTKILHIRKANAESAIRRSIQQQDVDLPL